ncbi:rbm-7, partial [Pristionchus pacificus]|uniref:RNA binding protein n=1 Tax=Pristionchus pacificus TaxID=54126 RepID=A0A2A6CCX1_PRIPA
MASKDERSVYITNFSAEVTEDLLKELFIQVGPVETVFVKKNDTGGRDFALVAFVHPESVLFAVETLDEIRLFNTPLNVKPKMGTEQEKAYRRKQEEQRNSRLNSTPTGHGDYGSYLLNSLSSGMILPPPPIPPNIFVTPNGNVHHSPLTSIPYGPGGVHPSVMAGYNIPPGFNGPPADWRGSMPSLIDPSSSSRNSYDRDNRRDNKVKEGEVMREERVIDGITVEVEGEEEEEVESEEEEEVVVEEEAQIIETIETMGKAIETIQLPIDTETITMVNRWNKGIVPLSTILFVTLQSSRTVKCLVLCACVVERPRRYLILELIKDINNYYRNKTKLGLETGRGGSKRIESNAVDWDRKRKREGKGHYSDTTTIDGKWEEEVA